MTKENVTAVFKHHQWVLIEHKRGYARTCTNCGKTVYYGKHKKILAGIRTFEVMAYMPNALALPHGVNIHTD